MIYYICTLISCFNPFKMGGSILYRKIFLCYCCILVNFVLPLGITYVHLFHGCMMLTEHYRITANSLSDAH